MNAGRDKFIYRTSFHLIVVLVLGFLAYSNIFHVPFVFDDLVFSEGARGKSLSEIPAMFIDLTGKWASRPLMHATLALNYTFGGMNPASYHAVNLALHLINALLLYMLVIAVGRRISFEDREARLAAFASALLFVVHPAETEAVTYVISRSMLLSTAFYLGGLILFDRAVSSEKPSWKSLAGLFVVSLLGVASRENFATFPLMLFLYDALLVSRLRVKDTLKHWRAYVPALVAFGYFFYIVFHHTYAKEGGYGKNIPPVDYMLTQLRVHWTYIRLIVLPINQNADYDYPIAATLFSAPTLLAFAGYVGLWALGVSSARKRPAAALAIIWLPVALLPVSFLIALADVSLGDVIFEHRLYLPSIGLIALAGVSLARLSRSPSRGKIVCALSIVLAITLGAATYARNSVWSSAMSFWGDVVEKSPMKERGYNNIAILYQEAGDTGKAIAALQKAMSMDPDIPQTHHNLANIYSDLGRTDEALDEYLAAIRLRPEYVSARVNLGVLYKKLGMLDKAIEQYEIAVSFEPDEPDPYYNLANAYMRKGRYQDAVPLYERAIRIGPDSADYHNNLSVAYRQLGFNAKADEEQSTAERLRGN